MDREGFLRILREQLSGELIEAQISSQIRYYDQYIGSEMAKGRTEKEVVESLGDPRLIAKTLIDTKRAAIAEDSAYEQTGYEADSTGDSRKAKKIRWLDLSTWYGKALVIVFAIMIIALVVTVLSALLPFLIVIFCISILVRYFKGRS